jgi:glycosyltransferase involved in cell wall biosynthesis
MNILDINISSSKTKGFPNVIPEAMLCGTPFISTNVEDASMIIKKMVR